MALVCEIKSELKGAEQNDDAEKSRVANSSVKSAEEDDDLEDGEIEDDEDEEMAEPPSVATAECSSSSTSIPILPDLSKPPPPLDSPTGLKIDDKKRDDKTKRHEKKHLTEAEKSVMRLHKMERMEREKREKYRRDQVCLPPPIDPEEDFATSLEKALAKVLKKDKYPSEDEKQRPEEEKRCKKRKRRDKHNKKMKKCKQDSPKDDELDDSDMYMQGGSRSPDDCSRTTNQDNEESYDSEASSSDKSREPRVQKVPNKRFENRNKNKGHPNQADKRNNMMLSKTGKRNTGVCLHYLQGHCDDDNCPYSHETVQPMKLELCKFYLLECCAKGDKCLYMHSDFPCKYYHTGIPCPFEDSCKFAHGGPLSEGLKQILFKHIETAPKEILGNFPRLSRENASVMIIQAQKNLEMKYGPIKKDCNMKDDIPCLMEVNFPNALDGGSAQDCGPNSMNANASQQMGNLDNKNRRNRPSRWQDPEPAEKLSPEKPLAFGNNFKDQDMRINSFSSNGDVDMRTLNLAVGPPKIHPTSIVNPTIMTPNAANLLMQGNMMIPNILTTQQQMLQTTLLTQSNVSLNDQPPVLDIEKYKMDAMGTKADISASADTDIRNTMDVDVRPAKKESFSMDDDDCDGLQIVMDEEEVKNEPVDVLLKSDLIKRIQVQSKESAPEESKPEAEDNEDNNTDIDWYSDDEDENKLTIKDDDFEDAPSKDEPKEAEPAPIKPLEMIEKLGDLSKIDISAEVTKLLSSINQQSTNAASKDKEKVNRDPRLATADPRRNRVSSTEEEQKRPISIYSPPKSVAASDSDQDLRTQFGTDSSYRPGGRPDVDLRQIGIPFKGIQNYTPATEIDASINSHPPITWVVYVVEIPKPDYTGLKLSSNDAQANGDPRLRKIFRLSTEEIDSPASPKESPKVLTPSTPRVDPRRRKMESEANSAPSRPDVQVPMNYNQQLAMLQSSPFYQTLTSNQKVMLNQEISMSCNDKTGPNNPIISSILQNLGLVAPCPQSAQAGQTQAMSILANVNKLVNNYQQTPPNIMPPVNTNMGPGLLGAGPPGLQNLPSDYPMNFNAGILGNGPPPPFQNNYPPQENPNNFGNFTDDYYPDQPPPQFNPNNNNNNRDNRGFRENNNRGNRNRGRNNNRNNRNFFRRHNRNNRNNSP